MLPQPSHIEFLTFFGNAEHLYRAGNSYPNTVDFAGDGTKLSPWELATQKDLETLRSYVSEGYDFADTYFCMVDNISLDASWGSIG